MNQLKDKRTVDKELIKAKLVKSFKVLALILLCLGFIHLASNYMKYKAICQSNQIQCNKLIVSNKTLEKLSNDYSDETNSVVFSSPLTTEKNKLVEDIELTISKINKLNKTLTSYKLTSEEQEELNNLKVEFSKIGYTSSKKYKKDELEEIDSSTKLILNELQQLDESVKVRLLRAKIKDIESKISNKINKINKLNLNADEKVGLSGLSKEYNGLTNSNSNTSTKLQDDFDQLSTIYSKLKELESEANKRITNEQAQKKKNNEEIVLEDTYENSSNNNSVKEETATNATRDNQVETQVDENIESKETTNEEKQTTNTSDICYPSYNEAQQVGMQEMIEDPTIQKMEVDGNTNCIKYYR